jgi:DNA-binding NtrC family response regulator
MPSDEQGIARHEHPRGDPVKAILVATANKEAAEVLRTCLSPEYRVETAAGREACFEMSRKRHYEFVLVDMGILTEGAPASGFNIYKSALQPFWQYFPTAEIIVLASQEAIRDAVNAVKAGAGNYITYPVNPEEVRYVMESLQESQRLQSELDYLRDRFWRRESLDVVRTNSPVMKEVFNKVRSVAPTDITVLLSGETGTGKGVLAQLIHSHSNRSGNQFISLHCGAIPETLLESELFGHERGSFTGAVRRKMGRFEIARGGTIFLDEIGTITAAMQIKLLQIIQDKTFQRVGGDEVLDADVRIIAATNEDLKKKCEEGTFRRDLFYRLNVFPIELPSIRDRREDIPLLVESFLKRFNRLHGRDIQGLDPLVTEAFDRYLWPGNIRELENLMERAYILEKTPILTPESFPSEIFDEGPHLADISPDGAPTLAQMRRLAVEKAERQYLTEILTVHQGSIKGSASAAGVTVRQLHKLMTRYGIRKEDYKVIEDAE